MTRLRYLEYAFERDTAFPLISHALFIARAGSRAYNTFTDDSDYDYFGVVIPPVNRILGLTPFESWEPKSGTLEQSLDIKVYGLAKAIRLLLKGNPNMLEVLWYPDHVYEYMTLSGRHLIEHRDIFSSKRAYKSLAGYAKAQFDQMMRGTEEMRLHWDWSVKMIESVGWTVPMILTKQSLKFPTKEQFSAAAEVVLEWPGQLGTTENPDTLMHVLHRCCDTIKEIHNGQFRQYMGEKRKQMVLKHGYDVKNASHLVRLLYMGIEFAQTGRLTPWLGDWERSIVLDIKAGNWALDALRDYANDLWQEAEEAFAVTALPDEPDTAAAEDLLIRLTGSRMTATLTGT